MFSHFKNHECHESCIGLLMYVMFWCNVHNVRPTRMSCPLCTILVTQVNQWLTKNVFITFIRLNSWIGTQNNKLSWKCMNDIRHYAMSTKMPHCWKRLMFGMWPFNVSQYSFQAVDEIRLQKVGELV